MVRVEPTPDLDTPELAPDKNKQKAPVERVVVFRTMLPQSDPQELEKRAKMTSGSIVPMGRGADRRDGA